VARITKTVAISTVRLGQRRPDPPPIASLRKLKEEPKSIKLVGHHCGIATVPMLVLWLSTQGREANTGAIASP